MALLEHVSVFDFTGHTNRRYILNLWIIIQGVNFTLTQYLNIFLLQNKSSIYQNALFQH